MAMVSQEHFDCLVQESKDEFELTWEEAVAQALEELRLQKVQHVGHLCLQPPEERQTEPDLTELLVSKRTQDLERLEKLVAESEPLSSSFSREGGCAKLLSMLSNILASDQSADAGDLAVACCSVIATLAAHDNPNVCASLRKTDFEGLRICPDRLQAVRAARKLAHGSEPWVARFVDRGGLRDVVTALEASVPDLQHFTEACGLVRTMIIPEGGENESADALGRCRVLCGSKDANTSHLPPLGFSDGKTTVSVLAKVVRAKQTEATASDGYVLQGLKTLKVLARADDISECMHEEDVLQSTLGILAEEGDDREVVKTALGLLRNLCGNERCRQLAMRSGAASRVCQVMRYRENDAIFQEICCGAIATMSLRSAAHAEAIAASGGVEHGRAMKASCLALSNLSSRSSPIRDQICAFPKVERSIRNIGLQHPHLADTVHVLLRQLDLLLDSEYICPFQFKQAPASQTDICRSENLVRNP